MDVSDYLWKLFFWIGLGPLKNRTPGGSIRGNTVYIIIIGLFITGLIVGGNSVRSLDFLSLTSASA